VNGLIPPSFLREFLGLSPCVLPRRGLCPDLLESLELERRDEPKAALEPILFVFLWSLVFLTGLLRFVTGASFDFKVGEPAPEEALEPFLPSALPIYLLALLVPE
jgi:hypothetical protein